MYSHVNVKINFNDFSNYFILIHTGQQDDTINIQTVHTATTQTDFI